MSLLQRFICPFCLIEIRSLGRISMCPDPECGQALPALYLHDYATIKPLFTQIFGWSQVGKTVYLQALTLILARMSNFWPRYSASPATDFSQQVVRDIRTYLERGVMPRPTPVGDKSVYIMQLYNMARWGSRALVTRDFAGELFDTMTISTNDVPYLPYAPTTLMMLGPDGDVSYQGNRTVEQLLNNYVNTLLHHGVDFSRSPRALIVVLTKADSVSDLPSELRSYLIKDPVAAALTSSGSHTSLDDTAMDAYLNTMKYVSDCIKNWAYDRSAHWKTFIRIAAQRQIDLRFTLISSTGSAVSSEGQLTEGFVPRRVLDPYFWAIELQSDEAGQAS